MFAHVACRPDDELDLAVAALLIAEAERPGLDVARYLAVLDRWGEEGDRAAAGAPPGSLARFEALRHLLFVTHGLRGNQDDYYDPDNSFLDQVIDRRLGIPITLSIVFLEVARRMGIEARGIGFPGHFLVRAEVDGDDVFVDPFHMGDVLDVGDLRERLEAVAPGAELDATHLAAVDKRHILTRVLTNLRAIYARRGDHAREQGVATRLALLARPTPGDGGAGGPRRA